jgi:hypothetical protein
METETIEVPHFDGYRYLGFMKPRKGMYVLSNGGPVLADHDFESKWLVYEKLPPKRYVFEETGEERGAKDGDVYIDPDGYIQTWSACWPSSYAYKILRRVED